MSEALADAFSGVKPVEARHRFDEAALDRWMQAHVDGYAGPLGVFQFKGGQSNPTYRLETPAAPTCSAASPSARCCPRPTRWTGSSG